MSTKVNQKSAATDAPAKKKRKVIIRRRPSATTIFTSKELTNLARDILDPVRITESITGHNIVEELRDEKNGFLKSPSKDFESAKNELIRNFLNSKKTIGRETFIGVEQTRNMEMMNLLGGYPLPRRPISGRDAEINVKAF